MCESRHLESGSESRHLESESSWIRIHPYFLESESNCFESGFESSWPCKAPGGSKASHTFVGLVEKMKNSRGVIATRNLESGFESESESTLFSLNPNTDSYSLALNPNPDPNPAQKALNPDSNPNPDSDSHITGSNQILHSFCKIKWKYFGMFKGFTQNILTRSDSVNWWTERYIDATMYIISPSQ